MNPVIFEIKEELKFLAKEIRRIRQMRKQIPNAEFDSRSDFDARLDVLKREFRINHIAYCTLRGTPRKLIEPSTHDKAHQNVIFFHANKKRQEFEARLEEYENEKALLSSP